MTTERLSSLAPALHFSLQDLEWFQKTFHRRDIKGSEWCRRKGIGKRRRQFERYASDGTVVKLGEAERSLAHACQQGRDFFVAICRECPLNCPKRSN